jgi:hypothetical protein
MHTTDPHGGGGYEKRDAKIRPLVESGIVLVALCAVSFWSMIYLHHWLQNYELKKESFGNALTPAREIPPAPLLETAAHMPVNWSEASNLEKQPFKSSSLADVRSDEAQRLNSYGWIDEPGKIVHIPIQQAMQKLLEQGVPTRK